MGSHPTLDHRQLAAEALQLDPGDGRHSDAVAPLATEHSQVRTWPDDNANRAHERDHRDWIDDHPHSTRERDAEQAFDRLNPEFGVPADTHNPYGRRAVQDREAALVLGVRVAVHDSRQNDRNPVTWQAGQDYRAADAINAARRDLVRARHGPERVGPER
jgi:hypothetical protein